MHKDKAIQARLLQDKTRFTDGLRGEAYQGKIIYEGLFYVSIPHPLGLQAILQFDPSHREARELLPSPGYEPTMRTRLCELASLSHEARSFRRLPQLSSAV